jgi:hypothetical protein
MYIHTYIYLHCHIYMHLHIYKLLLSTEKISGFRARLVARKLANEERARSITPPNTHMDDFEVILLTFMTIDVIIIL